jgi:signal transduction histidine kinase
MRQRITSAIVGVTVFVLLALGIPLAIVVQRSVVSAGVVRLQADTFELLADVTVPVDPQQLASIAAEDGGPPPFAVYDANGVVVFGTAPATPEGATAEAFATGEVATSTGRELVVAAPIVDDDEQSQGVLRVARSREEIDERTRVLWMLMALAGGLAVAAAWLLARRLAGRLATPLAALAASANDLVDGMARDELPNSGIAEIDQLADALHASSARVAGAMARERQFSDDVSHQLRTPLAGMRLTLEAAHASPEAAALAEHVLADLDRMDATVSHLLAEARGATPAGATVDPAVVVTEVDRRWQPTVAAAGRTMVTHAASVGTMSASAVALEQALDVLVDNALRHGSGEVTVSMRAVGSGAAIAVADEGSLGDEVDERRLFERGVGHHHGIGLALARSLIEGSGGRVLLTARRPTTFTVFLVAGPQRLGGASANDAPA